MSKDRGADVLIAEAELLGSSADRVYEWFKNRSAGVGKIQDEASLDEVVELKLLDRNEALIDIAIAKYGAFSESVSRVFKKAKDENNEALLLSCLTNTSLERRSWSHSSVPRSLIKDAKERLEWFTALSDLEIKTLFENPTIDQEVLDSFLEGKEYWKAVDDEKRRAVIRALANNARMSSKYNSEYMDGYAEYRYNSVFDAAWKLCEITPTTPEWANDLSYLYEKLVDKRYKYDSDTIAKRWMLDWEHDKEDDKKAYLNPYENIRAKIYKCNISNKYGKDESNKEYFDNADIAIRWSAYKKLRLTEDEIQEAYEKDKLLAINALIDNYAIWKDPALRKVLHDVCWDADTKYNNNYLDCANHFNYKQEEVERQYPDWFVEEEEKESIDEDDMPVTIGRLRGEVGDKLYQYSVELLTEIFRVEKETKKTLSIVMYVSIAILVVLVFKAL